MLLLSGVKDIVPQPTENTYEGFEDLIDRMNYWFKEQSDMHITNLQSVMVQKQNGTIALISKHYLDRYPISSSSVSQY